MGPRDQLKQWSETTISAQQRKEVERLQGQMKKLCEQITAILTLADELAKDRCPPLPAGDDSTAILTLADELAKGTIEKVMKKSDGELEWEFLLNPERFKHL